MGKPAWLSVDLGTSGIKVGIVDSTGTVLAQAARPVKSSTGRPTGDNQQDAVQYAVDAIELMAEVVAAAGTAVADLNGVVLDGQMAGVVAVDAAGRALTPWLNNVEENLTRWRSRILRDHAAAIRALTGGSPYLLPGIKAIEEHSPEIYRRAAKFTPLACFVAGQLCRSASDQYVVDTSHLLFSGLADAQAGIWDAGLAAEFGVGEGQLPRIGCAGDRIGGLDPEVARRTGLPAGLPVLTGLGDQMAGFLGAGLADAGVAVDVAGSNGCFAVTTGCFRPDDHYDLVRSPDPGRWVPYMTVLGSGLSQRWLAQILAGGATVDPAEWERLLAAHPDPGYVVMLPHLVGRGCPPFPEMRGALMGMTWSTTAEDLYLGFMASVVFANAVFLGKAASLLPDLDVRAVHVIGGGAASRTWTQLRADVMGMPYRRPRHRDATLIGCAMIGSVSSGVHPDLRTAGAAMVSIEDAEQVDPERHRAFGSYVEFYDKFEQRLNLLFEDYDALPGLPARRLPASLDLPDHQQ